MKCLHWVTHVRVQYMCAIMDVDQWGAIVLTSEAEARRLNARNMIYVLGTGQATESGNVVVSPFFCA